jgi:hypothetical protein
MRDCVATLEFDFTLMGLEEEIRKAKFEINDTKSL